jgi:hypothetical protein
MAEVTDSNWNLILHELIQINKIVQLARGYQWST